MAKALSPLLLFLWLLLPLAEPSPTAPPTGYRGKAPLPRFSVSWADDRSTFLAGDTAMIKIKPWGDYPGSEDVAFDKYVSEFTLSVKGKKGNSSLVSGVYSYSEGDPSRWNITFVPIAVGEFAVSVTEEFSGVSDASLHFSVQPGNVYPPDCIAVWMNNMNEFVAGTKARVCILPKDAFGNNISSVSENWNLYGGFTVAANYENGSIADIPNITYTGWDNLGCLGIEFTPLAAGSFVLHVLAKGMTLSGSPLMFNVKSGPLVVSKCIGKWKYETNALQIFSKLEFFIYQRDQFDNLVPDFYPFDARVVNKGMNLSIPVADIFFSEAVPGIQLLSFIVSEPGEFTLVVFDGVQNESISNTPHDYTVFVGYCHGSNSVMNGSGLVASVAGQLSYFTIYLADLYYNPSSLEVDNVHIQILRRDDSANILPAISPVKILDDGTGTTPIYPIDNNSTSSPKPTVQASIFNVTYTPDKSGAYEVRAFCGNVPLNSGQPFLMTVSPGLVDTSLSRVIEYVPRVKRLAKNEIIVQLIDSFSNPVLYKKENLSLTFDSSGLNFLQGTFVEKSDGLYTGYYVARDIGTYKICVSFVDAHLPPCPFEVNVYRSEYFPEPHNDTISVWEDESIAFDVLRNDYYPGSNASIINSSMPLHGSILQYGDLLRYTPLKGFSGNDSFSYTILDVNNNTASSTVGISVLNMPPQFVSLPELLKVTEDVLSPKFGGFLRFVIKYSDPSENISVTVRAKSGTISLAPMPLQLWQTTGNKLFVAKVGGGEKDLFLAGNVELINFALKFIQYLGDENFCGNDILSLFAMNKNGVQDAHVPVFVEPVNDPPFINVPEFVVFDEKEIGDGIQIFAQKGNLLGFPIGDPDLFNSPGNKTHFLVTFSIEVSDGMLVSRLPVDLLNTVEMKIFKSHHWQHLQTFVTISNHVTVKAKGIRIRGTIKDCNNALQKLLLQDVDQEAILTIRVNDMGNYGSNSDYEDKASHPLSTEVVVKLIKRKPISAMTAHLLGSAIIIEFILMLSLGGVLIFFLCKCTNALQRGRTISSVHQLKNLQMSNLHEAIK